MPNQENFNSQFLMDYRDYMEGIDLSSWNRYYFIIKEIIRIKPKTILEIGAGSEIVKNCVKGLVEDYRVMDINEKLKPDILSDLRDFRPELKEKFDCLVCAEVLEHMPFRDLEKNLDNIRRYLIQSGKLLITIPHRRARFMIITPFNYQKPIIFTLPFFIKSSPKSFYNQVIKRKIWIDPHHCWEIGDGKIEKRDVETAMEKVGFNIEKFMKLLHVDFWVLTKKA